MATSVILLCSVAAPAVLVVSMEGVAGCVDPALLQWFSYTPRKHTLKVPTSDICAAAVDMPLAQATSPLQTGGSHSEYTQLVTSSTKESLKKIGDGEVFKMIIMIQFIIYNPHNEVVSVPLYVCLSHFCLVF